MYSYAPTNSLMTAEGDVESMDEKYVLTEPHKNGFRFNGYVDICPGDHVTRNPAMGNLSEFANMEDYVSPACQPHHDRGCLTDDVRAEGYLSTGLCNGCPQRFVYDHCSPENFEQGSRPIEGGCPQGSYQGEFNCYINPVAQDLGHSSSLAPPHHRLGQAFTGDLAEEANFLHAYELGEGRNSQSNVSCDRVDFPAARCYTDRSVATRPLLHGPAEPTTTNMLDNSFTHLNDLHHEVVRRRRRREQNRIAARRCREKKKENVDNMLKDYTETLKENERLRLETEKLQSLVERLQSIVKCHQTTCNLPSLHLHPPCAHSASNR